MVSTGRVPGTQLYYEVTGAGPPLVFVHSGGFDRRLWDEQFFAFADRHTVIRYDVRGHGKSPSPTKPYSDAEDLYTLLQWLHIGKAHAVGLSLGGSIVIDFALAHPQMIETLILVAPDVTGYAFSAEFAYGFIKVSRRSNRMMEPQPATYGSRALSSPPPWRIPPLPTSYDSSPERMPASG